jgi:hypothetical protein
MIGASKAVAKRRKYDSIEERPTDDTGRKNN